MSSSSEKKQKSGNCKDKLIGKIDEGDKKDGYWVVL